MVLQEEEKTQRHTGGRYEGDVQMEAETAVRSQAKQGWQPPEAGQGKEGSSSPGTFRGSAGLLTPGFQASGLYNYEK